MSKNFDPKIKIKFNIYGVKKDNDYSEVLNTEELEVYSKDTILQIKRLLALKLIKNIDKTSNKKFCKYCFKQAVVESKPSKPSTPKDQLTNIPPVTPSFNVIEPDDIESDFEDLLDDIEQSALLQLGGSNTNINKCQNCLKEYKDIEIFPIPELLYFWNDLSNDNYIKSDMENEGYQIGHSFQHKLKKMEYIRMNLGSYNFYNPYELLTNLINNNKFHKLENSFNYKTKSGIHKEFIKGVKNFHMFNKLKENFNIKKSDKYIEELKYDNLLLLSDYYDINEKKEIIINVGYLPEFCYLQETREEVNAADIISGLYWPFINYKKYYNHNYKNKEVDEYLRINTLEKWKTETEEYINIIKHMGNIGKFKLKGDIKGKGEVATKSTTRIFFTINQNESTIQYINFSNIYHSFKLNADVPYLYTYVPEESIFLERMYAPLKDLPEKLGWKMERQDIIKFAVKLPDTIKIKNKKISKKIYLQVALYENKKMDVTIPLERNYEIDLDENKLNDIIKQINQKLIKELNETEGGIFNNTISKDERYLPLAIKSNDDSNNIRIYNINFVLELPLLHVKNSEFLNNTLDNLKNCLFPFIYEDYKFGKMDTKQIYRYKRFDGYKSGNQIDKFLYAKFIDYEDNKNDIITQLPPITKDVIIDELQEIFKITNTEASFIFRKFHTHYFQKQRRKPIFGTYINISSFDKIRRLRININGVRNYQEMNNMSSFVNRLISLIKHLHTKSKLLKSNPKFREAIDYFKNNSLCFKKIIQEDYDEPKESEKTIRYNKLDKFRQLILCKGYYKEYEEKEKNTKDPEKKQKYQNILKLLEKKHQEITSSNDITQNNLDVEFPWLKSQDYGKKKISKGKIKKTKTKVQTISGPIGTASNYPPHRFIPFNYDRELKRLNEWPKCEIQKGGQKKYPELTAEYYENYYKQLDDKKYVSPRDLKNCTEGPRKGGYTKIDLQKLLRSVGKTDWIKKDGKKMDKNEMCKLIKSYLKDHKGTIKKSQGIFLNLEEDYDEIEKVLEKSNIKDYILNNLTKDKLQKIIKKYIQLFQIDTTNYKKDEIIQKVRYHIYNLDIWTNNELGKFFEAMFPSMDMHEEKDVRKLLIEAEFKKYKDTEILEGISTRSLKSIIKNKYLDPFWDIMKSSEKNPNGILVINDQDVETGESGGLIKQSTLNYFGRAISCPNYHKEHKQLNEQYKSIVTFAKSFPEYPVKEYKDRPDEIRKILCRPKCLNVKTKDKEFNNKRKLQYLFCAGEIDYSQYRDYYDTLETKNTKENYVSTKIYIVKNLNELGLLPSYLDNIFNNFQRYLKEKKINMKKHFFIEKKSGSGLNIDSPSFVLLGNKRGNKNILNVMSIVLNIDIDEVKNKIFKFINVNKELYNSLNQGMIAFKFKKLSEYYNYIDNRFKNIEIEWVLDLFSRPGLFHEKGLNIFIFSINEDGELIIKPPKHLFIEDYYDENKPNLYLYEYPSNKHIEPIVLKFPNSLKKIAILDHNDTSIFMKNSKKIPENDYKIYIKELNKFLGNWYYNSFKKDGSEGDFATLTAKNTIKLLEKNGQKNLIQLVDSFYKTIYIVDDQKNLIPVKPSGYVLDKPKKSFNNINDIFKYATKKSYKETKEYLNKFKKLLPKSIQSLYTIEAFIQDRNKKIVAVELDYNIVIPIKEYKRKSNDPEISTNVLEFDINQALKDKIEPEIDEKILKDEYNKEVYYRFLLELSEFLKNHNKITNMISSIMKELKKISNKLDEKAMKKYKKYKSMLMKIITNIFYKISMTDDSLLRNITKDKLKNDKILHKNRRKPCLLHNNKDSCNLDLYCNFDSVTGNCKIHIPLEKVKTIIGQVTEEFIHNTQNAINILNNNIDIIVDRSLIEEGRIINNMIYRKRSEN